MVATPATVVLHPAAEDVAEQHELAPRLPHLQGATVGLIDNHKKNADLYLEELGRQLQKGYGVSRLVTYRKVSQSLPTRYLWIRLPGPRRFPSGGAGAGARGRDCRGRL